MERAAEPVAMWLKIRIPEMKQVWFDREIVLIFERFVQLYTKFRTVIMAITFIEDSL